MVVLIATLSIALFAIAFAMSGVMRVSRLAVDTAGEAGRVMRDPALDDNAREKAVQQASLQLFGVLFGLIWRFLLIALISALPVLLAHVTGLVTAGEVLDFLMRWDVIVIASVVLIALWIAVARLAGPPAEGYGTTDRVLHRLALGGVVLPDVLHDVERGSFLKKAPPARDGAHVFISGLARAGTTVLTRDLYATGEFGSLTYRDMPLVLAPNLWGGLSRSSHVDMVERAHGDGLQVDLDSPEALDEVYWRVKDGKAYLKPDRMIAHKPDGETVAGYVDLIRLVLLKTGKRRYLSKNNNNILRLPALIKALPNARFLIPVRDPLQHAASLLRQHQRFGAGGGFEERYMGWLGHHEFGATHLPFDFGEKPAGDPASQDYWLALVLAVDAYLLALPESPAVQFVSHERLSSDPAYRAAILGFVDAPVQPGEIRDLPPSPLPEFAPELAARANLLRARLDERSAIGVPAVAVG